MKTINGYTYDETTMHVVNGLWNFAKKDGEDYFLKKFLEPKFPKEGTKTYEMQAKKCAEWEGYRWAIINALKKVTDGRGNIVTPVEVFRDGPEYVITSHKVDTVTEDPGEISKMKEEDLVLLLKTIASSISKIHSVGVIHGDLKPGNIIIAKTRKDRKVAKIIDMDDSYFTEQPPQPDETVGTPEYFSPELGIYKCCQEQLGWNEDQVQVFKKNITCKSDIFALGIIFHQYCTGEFPRFSEELPYMAAFPDNGGIQVDPNIKPAFMKDLIEKMIAYEYDERPTAAEVLLYLTKPPVEKTPMIDVLTDVVGGGGQALVNGKANDKVEKGTSVSFVAHADEGYMVDHWEVNGEIVNRAAHKKSINEKTLAHLYFKRIETPPDIETDEIDTSPITPKAESGGPRIEKTRNPNKVKVHFEDGHMEIMDKWIAESRGWM